MKTLKSLAPSPSSFFDDRLFLDTVCQLQLTYNISQLTYSHRSIVKRHPIDSGNGGLNLTSMLELLTKIELKTLILDVAQLTGQSGDGGDADGESGEKFHFFITMTLV